MTRWARLVRTRCTECGSISIEWHSAIDLPFLIPDVTERRSAVRTIELFGGDAEAWICTECGQFGIFAVDTYVPPARGSSFRRRRSS